MELMVLVRSKIKRDERRAQPRKSISQPAEISDRNKKLALQCVIKDASRDGCHILCVGIDQLPDEFYLKPANRDFTVKGTIVWREPYRAGAKVDWANTMFL